MLDCRALRSVKRRRAECPRHSGPGILPGALCRDLHHSHHSTAGFSLVATLLGIALLAGVVLAMVTLATIELRKTARNSHQEIARANARLALTLAIGQLQLAMGPDTRVSASSSLVMSEGHTHWTGVWNTQAPDGKPWVTRDSETGGLTDRRVSQDYDRAAEVMQWLVSGDPLTEEAPVILVGPGSVAHPETQGVEVPALNITTGNQRGKLAWWTGDLGQRANLTSAGREDQSPAPELIGNAPPLPPGSRDRLISEATLALQTGNPLWAKSHFHDYTVHSEGLLIDVRTGGLRKDLGIYLRSSGVVDSAGDSAGLSDGDRLTGPTNEQDSTAASLAWDSNPFRKSAPRFGVLRHWAGLAAAGESTISPETIKRTSGLSEAPSNLQPAKLDGAKSSSLQPILVEASEFHAFSWYKKAGDATHRHHLRKHLYPRITLWNPYAVPLTTRPMMVLLQTNGRLDFWIDGYFPGAKGKPNLPVHSPWVAFEGGRSRDFVPADHSIFTSAGFKDPHMGSHYYQLAATRFGPGECLVFTPERAADYQNGIKQDGGEFDLSANLLTATQAPRPERCLTISNAPGQPGFDFVPTGISMKSAAPFFALFGMGGLQNPADDLRVILKDMGDATGVDVETFDRFPQIALISGSLQYGAGRESVASWAGPLQIAIEETTDGPPRLTPDGKTRQGLRLRSGNSPTAAREAVFANWNPRAAYSIRSPRERFRPAEGHAGLKDAASGFGIYERFLPTANASWSENFPVEKGGSYHAAPLGHGKQTTPNILFDVPRKGTGVLSMGHLQHAKTSDLVWHPSRAIGNSLADPRTGLTVTVPEKLKHGGFTDSHIGQSGGCSWASAARDILLALPDAGEELLYDLTYEANHTLWDRYFISSIDAARVTEFAKDPLKHPLTNSRLELSGSGGTEETLAALNDFHQAASRLTVSGAFNVNSVSVDAWAAVLAGNRRIIPAGAVTSFPRISGNAESADLSDEQVRRLATAIVAEVKLRGPFLGMSDFVNRRLADDATGRCGALEAAIQAAGLNAELTEKFPLLDNDPPARPPEIPEPLEIDSALKPSSTAWGTEKFITQGDILQVLGDSLVARSDTFVIRAYGESADGSRAWCEAVIQRVPEPVTPVPIDQDGHVDFGRLFKQIRFRWLSPAEI